MSDMSTREVFGDAIRYWERGRIVYNVALALIVIAYFVANWPASKSQLTGDLAQGLFLLAVLANVAYCAAYPVDVFAQLSAFRVTWLRYRWVVFFIGLSFAAIIARFFSQSMFTNAG